MNKLAILIALGFFAASAGAYGLFHYLASSQSPSPQPLYYPTDPLPSNTIVIEHEKIKRISLSIALPALQENESYYAFIVSNDGSKEKYIGSMFPVQNSKYSITFTSEDDISSYDTLVIARESNQNPDHPKNIMKQLPLR